ncbi:hypothetical protein LRS13_12530 [Svornostia abyssi]|uniref:Uncharacterized protein n=1 Tax=Svornostia abyssi TaxID=2898438 RepID=A0ABY5PA02_9ACTN|nr:hypothetical protein LRS13_12530 [Parviterribacteraceae bacterium J379]
MVFDSSLDLGDGVVARVALRAFASGLAVDAAEVLIQAAVAAVPAVKQPAAALGAVERSAQVVLMLRRPISGDRTGSEDLLNLVEGVEIDDRVVAAHHRPASVGDQADVVVVLEQLVDRGQSQRLRPPLRCRTTAEPFLFEQLGQLAESPKPGGVEVERPGHQRCAFRVDDDRPDVASGDQLTQGEVSDRGLEGRAAQAVLLVESLANLGREIVGVVLGERREHSVHQPARGGLVDVLADGDQGDAHAE